MRLAVPSFCRVSWDKPGWQAYLLAALAHYFGVKLTVALMFSTDVPGAMVWLPNAVLLTALLRFRGERAWAFALITFISDTVVNLPFNTFAVALAFSCVNLAEVLITYLVMRRADASAYFERLQDWGKFLLAGPVIGAMIAGLLAASIHKYMAGSERDFFTTARVWWFGDALGLMVYTPLLLSFTQPVPATVRPGRKGWIGALLVLGLTGLVFFQWPATDSINAFATPTVLLPAVLFMAYRFGIRGAALTTAGLALMVAWLLATGKHPFGDLSPQIAVARAQEFILTICLVGIGFAVLLGQLRAHGAQLEHRVRERTRLLEDTNAKLAELNQSRTSMLAAACHDLRQPAHAMGLMISAMESGLSPADLRAQLPFLKRNAETLSGMLSTLMDLARLDKGNLEASIAPVSLDALMEDVQLQFRVPALQKGLSLGTTPSGVYVMSDAYVLRRIVFNVVANAVKYTQRGGVSLDVRTQNGSALLEVSDTGIGIDAASHARVFEEYARLDRSGEGLGIGLSVVRRACALLGHGLNLQSAPGKGTRVSLTMELADARHVATTRAADAASLAAAEAAPACAPGNRPLIAVVEDDGDVRRATTKLLESWDYDVVAGASLKEITQALDNTPRRPDILMSDYHVDQDNGLSIIAALRLRPGFGDVPVLLVTGDLASHVSDRAREARAVVLHKPVPSARLRATIVALHAAGTVQQP